MPHKAKNLEASIYQGNGSNYIAKQTVRHQSFYFIVRILQIIGLSLSIILCFSGLSRVEPKLIHSISWKQTDHSSSETPEDHSLLASHHINLVIDFWMLKNEQKKIKMND